MFDVFHLWYGPMGQGSWSRAPLKVIGVKSSYDGDMLSSDKRMLCYLVIYFGSSFQSMPLPTVDEANIVAGD